VTNETELIRKCGQAAERMRKNALKMALLAGPNGAHLGAGLSIIEIMATLYCGVMTLNSQSLTDPDRDRFILSKGHGTLGFYPALEAAGIITEEQLFTFEQNGGFLPGQPSLHPELGIEYSSGTLGLGLSYATGVALALRNAERSNRVYVLLGDGECNEGTVWEAAMAAVHYRLSNLTVIVDANSMQSDGKTSDILNLNLVKIWDGFGWEVAVVADGHNIAQLWASLTKPASEGKPRVIIARTVKGKGVSFMENNNEWHHNRLSQERFDAALAEVTQGGGDNC
jgi:transketolase